MKKSGSTAFRNIYLYEKVQLPRVIRSAMHKSSNRDIERIAESYLADDLPDVRIITHQVATGCMFVILSSQPRDNVTNALHESGFEFQDS